MSIERAEGYLEALSHVRRTIQRRIDEPSLSNDGKLELLDLLSMLNEMLKDGKEPANVAPQPFDLAPWIALVLKLGSVDQETDDEEEPVQ